MYFFTQESNVRYLSNVITEIAKALHNVTYFTNVSAETRYPLTTSIS